MGKVDHSWVLCPGRAAPVLCILRGRFALTITIVENRMACGMATAAAKSKRAARQSGSKPRSGNSIGNDKWSVRVLWRLSQHLGTNGRHAQRTVTVPCVTKTNDTSLDEHLRVPPAWRTRAELKQNSY